MAAERFRAGPRALGTLALAGLLGLTISSSAQATAYSLDDVGSGHSSPGLGCGPTGDDLCFFDVVGDTIAGAIRAVSVAAYQEADIVSSVGNALWDTNDLDVLFLRVELNAGSADVDSIDVGSLYAAPTF